MVRTVKYRFHLDENFPIWIGKFFAARGHNVTYASRAKRGALIGATDLEQLRFAISEERILLTIDKDFSARRFGGVITRSPGVIAFRGDVKVATVRALLRSLTPTKLHGKLCRASVDVIRFIKPRS